MSETLYVAHRTAERTRLRLLGYRDSGPEALQRVAESCAVLAGVSEVDARPATGSLVIHHPGLSGGELDTALQELPFSLAQPPAETPSPALAPLTGGIESLDTWLRDNSTGRLDAHTAIVVVLLSLALSQALRGNIAVPATSLLWYALDVLLRKGGYTSV